MPIERAAPAAPAARTRKTAVTAVRQTRLQAREEALTGLGQMGTLFAVFKGWYADAGAIAQHAPKLSHEIALLGEGSEQIASLLDYLTETGPYMGLAKVGLPFVMQLAANHGRLDHSKLPPESGVINPAVLERKVKAEMTAAHARMLDEIRALEARNAESAQREST